MITAADRGGESPACVVRKTPIARGHEKGIDLSRLRLFGLVLNIEIPLVGFFAPPCWLEEPDARDDVVVKTGKIAVSDEAAASPLRVFLDDAGFHFTPGPGLRFLIPPCGREIIVDAEPSVPPAIQCSFLFSSVIGALLHIRGMLPLHGCAFRSRGGSCVVIVGDKGAGKSSLAVELWRNGFPLLTDDVCTVMFDAGGQLMAHSGPPGIKVLGDVARFLPSGEYRVQAVSPLTAKVGVELAGSSYVAKPTPITEVIELSCSSVEELRIESVERSIDRLEVVVKNIFRRGLGEFLGRGEVMLDLAAEVAARVTVRRVRRPPSSVPPSEILRRLGFGGEARESA